MKHIKTFEGFLNEAYAPGDEEAIFYGVLRGITDGDLKPNGSDLEDWLEGGEWGENLEMDADQVNTAVKKLFGGWAGTANFIIGMNSEEVDEDDATAQVQDAMKKGFKFVGSTSIDGYEAIVLGKRKGGAGTLKVDQPLELDNYLYNIAGYSKD